MPRKANRPKRPYIAEMDEVRITREGDSGCVDYIEPGIRGRSIPFGKDKLDSMSDQDILDMHNEMIRAANEYGGEFVSQPIVEIPLGSPQVEYSERSGQWCPRGDVLRCIVQEDEQEGYRLPSVIIDDLELSWEEFGRILLVRNGWGMRIEFVDEEEIHRRPGIQVGEPD